MYTVIYSFEVKPGFHNQFIDAWRELTSLIFKHEGSLGSRLHKENEGVYLAYAQWPDKTTFDNAGSKMPSEAEASRLKMREACENIETLHKLEVVVDLLYNE